MLFSNLPADIQKEIKEELAKASEALQKAEDILRDNLGLNVPEENIMLPENIVLKLPRGYIRTLNTVSVKYKLDLLHDETLMKNLSYAIQYTDFINYVLNRTSLGQGGLSVGALFRKHAIINVMTIVEGIIIGFIEKTYLICSQCRDFEKSCAVNIASIYSKDKKILKKHVNCEQSFGFYHALECLKNGSIISDEEYAQLDELRDYRNHIHIQYINKNTKKRQRDFMEEDYSLGTYNKAIKLLHNVPNIIDRLLASCQSFKS